LAEEEEEPKTTTTTTTTRDRGGKPFAPLEALLPATRCKIWIDHAHDVCSTLTTTTTSSSTDNQYKTLMELNQVLTNRPKLFVKESKPLQRTTSSSSSSSSSRALAQLTTKVSTANKEEAQRNRAELSLPDQFAAMMNQADAERQWGMLKSSEAQRQKENEIRAALSMYTQQLKFGDSYVLTASKEDRKRMIRNDQLPSLTSVIVSDLDLRDLYRNQLLTAVDDVQAEVVYQLKQHSSSSSSSSSSSPEEEIDVTDVVDLMNQAYTACSKWFDLIAREDVEEAMEVVRKEEE
jgi:hypothetical protein